MNILLFIIILGVLVFVHELGHFLFAKLFKIRVDEFGFGYPPKMFKFGTFRGTTITMNWIPFGGFVKIFGESDDGTPLNDEDKKVSLIHKPRWQQFLVMFGGILFNLIFAWILFSTLYVTGITGSIQSVPDTYTFDNTQLMVTAVLEDSPADRAGLMVGDELKEYYNIENTVTVSDENINDVSDFINQSGEEGDTVGFVVLRDQDLEIITLEPKEGVVPGKYGVGINLDRVGEIRLPIHQAIIYGARNTVAYTGAIAEGFWQLVTGQISTDNVSGPVGIVKKVGDASNLGFVYLISFTALLSLNLAVLNLIPFPALDGGRILIIGIEAILRKRINPTVVGWVNTIGFFALIALMIVVTINDVIKLF